jgi:uncharacterized protein (DUF433 family)
VDDLLAELPDLEREEILACHDFAQQVLSAKTLRPAFK